MKIFNIEQIREWDNFTIENEPISSLNLMERASLAFSDWFEYIINYNRDKRISIFCGPGNNGGDGLAIARILNERSYNIDVYVCEISPRKSPDFEANFDRLPIKNGALVYIIKEGDDFPKSINQSIVIDAIFGSGLTRVIDGYWAELIQHINQESKNIISVDIPSGMFSDDISSGISIMADHVLSFEIPKRAFFFSENRGRAKEWSTRSIGLSKSFYNATDTPIHFLELEEVKNLLHERSKFQHKGDFGRGLLIGGTKGMMGAVVLSARACLRSGIGLLSAFVPEDCQDIMQVSVPEAMLMLDSEIPEKLDAIGIGPGLGKSDLAVYNVEKVLNSKTPQMVFDADALNIIAAKNWIFKIPHLSIITPHVKEFERLFGSTANSQARLELQIQKSRKLNIIIVLKGAYTATSLPNGRVIFNSTGNPGLATGGSGDVLTGMVTSFLAQGYDPSMAAYISVFVHGLAGDLASEKLGQDSLIASDIIDFIPEALKIIRSAK